MIIITVITLGPGNPRRGWLPRLSAQAAEVRGLLALELLVAGRINLLLGMLLGFVLILVDEEGSAMRFRRRRLRAKRPPNRERKDVSDQLLLRRRT